MAFDHTPNPHIFPMALTTQNVACLLPAPPSKTSKQVSVHAIAVSTLNGQATVNGSSQALGNDVDSALLHASRALADCIIVGAETARSENYGGVTLSKTEQIERRQRGQADIPPIAVITTHAELDPESRLFTDALKQPIIVTDPTVAAPEALARISATGAKVITVKGLKPQAIISELHALGFRYFSLEGGPYLYSQFFTSGLINSLNISIDPRISATEKPLFTLPATDSQSELKLQLNQCGVSNDGFVFLRYCFPNSKHFDDNQSPSTNPRI
ncbi:pyrimidine reductase, riboflavin biosynthesis [Corynebacterium mustelae]|uniref:Pyrimidine reductase, riboflavin biosynthesis n=2 Tax=Corynebacterium mustelae TaxID=571915 RepID=A0A0G3GY53_9CORY|nr:pyrimidine reductase, riboflavin biosynthesis [Corynebacterium mustelae]